MNVDDDPTASANTTVASGTGKLGMGKLGTVLAAVREGRITPRSLAVTAATVAWARLRWGVSLPGTPHMHHLPPRLLLEGSVTIGRDLRTMAGQARPQIAVRPEGTLILGDHVFINQGALVNCGLSVTIGDNTLIADFAVVSDDDEHSLDSGPIRREPVVIGANVWIGRNALVLPGVTIGDNTVIGAGSIVTKDIPANVVAVGAPAKVVRQLTIPAGWQRT